MFLSCHVRVSRNCLLETGKIVKSEVQWTVIGSRLHKVFKNGRSEICERQLSQILLIRSWKKHLVYRHIYIIYIYIFIIYMYIINIYIYIYNIYIYYIYVIYIYIHNIQWDIISMRTFRYKWSRIYRFSLTNILLLNPLFSIETKWSNAVIFVNGYFMSKIKG